MRTLKPLLTLLLAQLVAFACNANAQTAQQQPQPAAVAPTGYALIWADEFSGPDGTKPDPKKWNYDLGGNGWGNHELEFYTNHPQNAQIKSGNLVITAQKECSHGQRRHARLHFCPH